MNDIFNKNFPEVAEFFNRLDEISPKKAKPMPKAYKVTIRRASFIETIVHAEDENEANDLAEELVALDSNPSSFPSVVEVKEIKE